jgi:hypothetical protein
MHFQGHPGAPNAGALSAISVQIACKLNDPGINRDLLRDFSVGDAKDQLGSDANEPP